MTASDGFETIALERKNLLHRDPLGTLEEYTVLAGPATAEKNDSTGFIDEVDVKIKSQFLLL